MHILIETLKTEMPEEKYNKFMSVLAQLDYAVNLTFTQDSKNQLKGSYDSYGYGGSVTFPKATDIRMSNFCFVLSNYILNKSTITRAYLNDDIVANQMKPALENLTNKTKMIITKLIDNI